MRTYKSINKITTQEDNIKKAFFTSLVFFVVSLVLQLSVTNHLALKGKEMVSLEKQKTALEKELSELELEKSKYLSLSYIQERAFENGFIENSNYVYLINPNTAQASIPTL